MAYSAPPARTEISDTYPNPSNAVARVGFGKLWDYVTGLLGSTGSPTAAKAALLIPLDIDFTNRIINGAMMIDQRNAGASVTPASGQYVVDRFRYTASQASKITQQRSTTAPSGFVNSLISTVSSAVTAGATDYFGIEHLIEGFNVADLGWGTASAQSVTLSVWVRSSVTGTYALRFTNDSSNRSYVATYTINSANTFEYKTITLAGDTSGTWYTDNRSGITVWFDLGSGSNYNTTAGTWAAGNYTRTSGSANWIANAGATFYITGVQLEKGTAATGFAYRPYGTELALCQRYYSELGLSLVGRVETSANSTLSSSTPVKMRASPTATVITTSSALIVPGVNAYAISSSLVTAAYTDNGVRLTFGGSTGMTAGNVIQGNADRIVGLSAEL